MILKIFKIQARAMLLAGALLCTVGLAARPGLNAIGAWSTFHGSRFMAGVTAGKGLSVLLPALKHSGTLNSMISDIKSGPTRLALETIKDKCLPTVLKLATVAYMPQLINRGADKLPARAGWLKPAPGKLDTQGRFAFLLGMAAGPLLKLMTYQYEMPVPFDGWQKPL